jgi:hypothetical protein
MYCLTSEYLYEFFTVILLYLIQISHGMVLAYVPQKVNFMFIIFH